MLQLDNSCLKMLHTLDHFIQMSLGAEKYSLSYWRDQPKVSYDDVTLSFVRDKFADDVSTLSIFAMFWRTIEKNLKSYKMTVQDFISPDRLTSKTQEEVWNTFAKRYKTTVKELIALNPGVTNLVPGIKLNVPSPYSVSLSLDTPESKKLREQIAREIFPRLTKPQEEALLGREDRLISYLDRYDELSKPLYAPPALTTVNVEEVMLASFSTLAKLEEFIKISPLRSHSKQVNLEWLTSIAQQLRGIDLEKDPKAQEKFLNLWEHVKLLYDQVKEKSIPTYENTLRVMYPLLADVQFLLDKFAGSRSERGAAIGSWDSPLEMLIQFGKELPHDDIYHKAAVELETRIAEVTKPSRFFDTGKNKKIKYEAAINEFHKRINKV